MMKEEITTRRKAPLGMKLVLSFILFFIFFELVLRVYPIARLEITPQHFYRHHEKLGWDLTPNNEARFRTTEYDHLVKINSRGFRDKERNDSRIAQGIRIVGMGDSFAFGYGVGGEQTYLQLLEGKLNRDASLRESVEILNMGIPGYSFLQNYLLTKEVVLDYQPDMILLGFSVNDHIESIEPVHRVVNGFLVRNMEGSEFLLKERLSLAKQFKTFHFLWKLWVLAQDKFFESPEKRILKDADLRAQKKDQALSLVRKKLTEWKQLCDERGIDLVIIYVPNRSEIYPDRYPSLYRYYFEGLAAWLQETTEGLKIPYINLRPRMIDFARQGEDLYYRWDGHWNKTGHERASEIISRELREKILGNTAEANVGVIEPVRQ